MKPNELRLGNLFIEENTKEIISVIGLEKDRVIFSGMFLDKWQAKPIPLTEKWLLDFGFISNPYKDRYEKGDIDVECDKTKGKIDLWLSGLPHIKSVHQLQNFYFAYTNEELTLNK